MKRILIIAFLLFPLLAGAQEVKWSRTTMDGSRTGCSAPGTDNVAEALGSVKGNKYAAPNGRCYKGGTVAAVAKDLISVQPAMADVKSHLGTCPEGMTKQELFNFATDILLAATPEQFGIQADMAILNSGGIRADMPKGDIIKDDMLSMFPFHNRLVLVELKGKDFKEMIDRVFGRRPQPFSGVELRYQDRALVSATVKGEQIDPDKTYYLATVDFLLGGGDRMKLGTGAVDIKYTDQDVIDLVLAFLAKEQAAGRPIVGVTDDRLIMEGEDPIR